VSANANVDLLASDMMEHLNDVGDADEDDVGDADKDAD